MTTSHDWIRGHMRDLDTDECMELLASRAVGRVAFTDDQGPVVLPVNYVVAEGGVLFRTAPTNSIAHHLNGRPAAFEVDDVDDFTESGWSVLLRGTGEFVESVDDLRDVARPLPWPDGTRSLFVRIRPRSLTGRRVFAN